jgi:hypothetical protein
MSHRFFLAVVIGAALQPATSSGLMAETVELPARKSGHWEIRMVHETPAGSPDTVIQACIDEATDNDMMRGGLSMAKEMCSKTETKREGSAIVIDGTCTMGTMKTTSHTVITGDFQSAYTVKITGEVDGISASPAGAKGPMKTAMTQNAKWLGVECPAEMKPGDMQMPGGIKVNVNDMFKKTAPQGNPQQK